LNRNFKRKTLAKARAVEKILSRYGCHPDLFYPARGPRAPRQPGRFAFSDGRHKKTVYPDSPNCG